MKKKNEKNKLNLKSERGSEILQVILIAGVLLVIVVTVFYPQMEGLFGNMMDTITTWFENKGSAPFTA